MSYTPMLRWKRGEQTALANLSDDHKRQTTPLITIASHSYTPPPGDVIDVSFDARVTQDADRLRGAWGGYQASVDFGLIEPDAECAGGDHPLTRFFAALRGEVDARPVLRASSDARFVEAAARLRIPPTFRLTPDNLADPDVSDLITDFLRTCEAEPHFCDLIIDLGYIATAGRSAITARGSLVAVPFLNQWRTVTLASGSFPENLSQFAIGTHLVPRVEWEVWQNAIAACARSIGYGDYATIHPNPVEEGLDPRTMNPTASVRYTYDINWLLLRGEGTRNRGGRGFAQFQEHCANLLRRPEYRGEAFSFGDSKIARIARQEDGTGSLETWVTIGINHHIAEIVGQLASRP